MERSERNSFRPPFACRYNGKWRGITGSAVDKKVSDNSSHQDNEDYHKRVAAQDIAYNTMRMWQGASGVSSLGRYR